MCDAGIYSVETLYFDREKSLKEMPRDTVARHRIEISQDGVPGQRYWCGSQVDKLHQDSSMLDLG